MSGKHKAFSEILLFLNSDKQCLRITGTHQNEKITLALAALLTEYPSPATILLRTNGMRNATTFLSPVLNLSRNIQTGTPINVSGGYRLYVDTINARTWGSSPTSIDVGVAYPIDSLKYDEGDRCVHDLLRRGASSVCVNWNRKTLKLVDIHRV